jgi:hypothetical protein
MDYLEQQCFPSVLTDDVVAQCQPFHCGDADLDEFFSKDTSNYKREMLGKSYCFRQNENPAVIVCAFPLLSPPQWYRHSETPPH